MTWDFFGSAYRTYLDMQAEAFLRLFPPEYGPDRYDLGRILFHAGLDPRRARHPSLWTRPRHPKVIISGLQDGP